MLLDVRAALRSCRLSHAFTATAVATLALGIGATTAIFSMVDAVLLRPLPFREPERLVRIWESNPTEGKERFDVAPRNLVDWQTQARGFAALALFDADTNRTVLGTPAGSLQGRVASVTPNLFSLLGIQPQLGRAFSAEADAASDVPREIVISHLLWRTAFAADPAIVGKTARIEGRSSFVIVGVMPAGFSFPGSTDLWFAATKQQLAGRSRDARFSAVIGRLNDGFALATARADLETVAHRLARDYPATNGGWTVAIAPLQDALVGHTRLALMTLLGAVTLVLLVACANVGNLLLARATARRRELAVRAALGATRGRLVRQLLTESLLLSVAGGALGWLLASVTLPVLWRLAGDAVPRVEAEISGIVLAFCAVLSIGTTLLVGLVPAFSASRLELQEAVQSDGERSAGVAGRTGWQQILVAVQLATALVLVVGAVLLVKTVVQLRRIDLGFTPDHVISLDLRVPFFAVNGPTRWFKLAETSRAVIARVRGVPSVEAAATTSDPPLSGNLLTTRITIRRDGSPARERAPGEAATARMALYHRVSAGYFATVGIPLLIGRDFGDDDASNESQLLSPTATPRDGVAIVNEAMARTFWPGEQPVGQYLSTSFDRRTTGRRLIVGIVRDAKSEALGAAAVPEVYVPYLEDPAFAFTLLVRTPLPPRSIAATLRQALNEIDPEISAANVRPLDDIVAGSMGSSRFNSLVVGLFAAAALLLAAIGVYGVLAFGVARRTREIGIRVALGATASDIQKLFLGQIAKAIGVGLGLGLAGSVAGARLMSSLLFGVEATDPLSFAVAALLLVSTALAAAYIPVRRALRMQPVAALRS